MISVAVGKPCNVMLGSPSIAGICCVGRAFHLLIVQTAGRLTLDSTFDRVPLRDVDLNRERLDSAFALFGTDAIVCPNGDSIAGGAVDRFPQQICMAAVAGILLDEVGHDPAQLDRLALALTNRHGIEGCCGRVSGRGAVDLSAQHDDRVSQCVALERMEVAVAIVRVVPMRGFTQPEEHLDEPVLLHQGEVACQPEQGEIARRGRHSRLLLGDSIELAEQHVPVVVEQPADHGTFVTAIRRNLGIEWRVCERHASNQSRATSTATSCSTVSNQWK